MFESNVHPKELRCCFCTEFCSTGFDLKCHVYSSHPDKKGYYCDVCGKMFRFKSKLDEHTPIHTDEKPYVCNICNKVFSYRITLKQHLKIHTGELSYECEVCSKKFIHKGKLSRHLKIHTGDKPYVCEICSKRFIYENSLTIHSRTHTGEKPFGCQMCGKIFSDKSTLSRHVLTHSETKPYACDLCGKKFVRKCQLRDHQSRCICRVGDSAAPRINLSKINAQIEKHQNGMTAEVGMHDYQLPKKVFPEYCNFDSNHLKAHTGGNYDISGTQFTRKESLMEHCSYGMGNNGAFMNVGRNFSENNVTENRHQMNSAASFLRKETIPTENASDDLDVCLASSSGINFQESSHKYHTHITTENDLLQREMDKACRDGQISNSHCHENLNYVVGDLKFKNFNPEKFSDQRTETFSNCISRCESNFTTPFQDNMNIKQFRTFNKFPARNDECTLHNKTERVLNDSLREKVPELPNLTQDILDSGLFQSSSSFREANIQGSETEFPDNLSIRPQESFKKIDNILESGTSEFNARYFEC